VTNLVTYHLARLRGYAAVGRHRLELLAISGIDTLPELECSKSVPCGSARTLFPKRRLEDIPAEAVRHAMWSALNELSPDVVIVSGWGLIGSTSSLTWAAANEKPVVLLSESSEFDAPRQWIRETAKTAFVACCSAGLVGGNSHREYLIKLGMEPNRVFLGYDVVDNEHFRDGSIAARAEGEGRRRALNLPPSYFFACARFDSKKNLCWLVETFSKYSEANPKGSSLVIVGDGDERDNIREMIERTGMGGRIHLPGARSYEQLPTYYGLARAFIHASIVEQWGLVVNEAMAAGLPVLVSRNCGCSHELVKDGWNGFLFNPRDPGSLLSRIRSIDEEDSLCLAMGRRSSELICEWGPQRFGIGLDQAVETCLRSPVEKSLLNRVIVSLF
jgi:glycosyltransferase involved in cell wall biosynthesis